MHSAHCAPSPRSNSNGNWQLAHHGGPRKRRLPQHAAQKRWSAAVTSPQPGQRGGSARSASRARETSAAMPLLVAGAAPLHKPHVSDSQASEIFSRAARRRRRDRAAPGYAGFAFLRGHMLEGLLERLDAVRREFRDVLDLGSFAGDLAIPGARIAHVDAGFGFAKASGGVQGDEDRLPFADASFDLVVSVGVL